MGVWSSGNCELRKSETEIARDVRADGVPGTMTERERRRAADCRCATSQSLVDSTGGETARRWCVAERLGRSCGPRTRGNEDGESESDRNVVRCVSVSTRWRRVLSGRKGSSE